jgi:hypothetical protein
MKYVWLSLTFIKLSKSKLSFVYQGLNLGIYLSSSIAPNYHRIADDKVGEIKLSSSMVIVSQSRPEGKPQKCFPEKPAWFSVRNVGGASLYATADAWGCPAANT